MNGIPCDGASVAIPYLNGCSSTDGYSIVSGAPCNGTTIATSSSPGLPVTGAGSNALTNLTLLFSLAVLAVVGGVYLAKKTKTTV